MLKICVVILYVHDLVDAVIALIYTVCVFFVYAMI